MLSGGPRKGRTSWQSGRRPAILCAVLLLGSAAVLAGSAGADSDDGILGGLPGDSSASTLCPAGSSVTGVTATENNLYIESVAAQCSGGDAVGQVGGIGGPVLSTGCGATEVAVGIVGKEDLAGVRQLALRCRASDLSGTTNTSASIGTSPGSDDGPYDCPDGQTLTGLTGSTVTLAGHLRQLQIQCGSTSTALPPQVGVDPASVDFGDQQVGSISAPQTVTVTNSAASGSDSLLIGQISLAGLNPTAFGFGSDTCSGATLAPQASCTVDVVFQPMGSGSQSANLSVPSNAASSPDSVTLTGNATSPPQIPPPTLGANPSPLSFGNQLVGSTSAAQTVTITNTAPAGSQSLLTTPPSIGGTNAADFSISSDTCTMAVLAPGQSCAVDVRFAPTAAGARSASLIVASNAPSSPDSIPLTGNGTIASLADVRVNINGPATAVSGSQNTYLVNVSNAGPATAAGVTMTMQIPNGTKFLSVGSTHGSCTHPASGATSGTVTCNLGDLASGAASINSIALKITLTGKGGTIALVAKASSASTNDPDLGNNVASLTTTVSKK